MEGLVPLPILSFLDYTLGDWGQTTLWICGPSGLTVSLTLARTPVIT